MNPSEKWKNRIVKSEGVDPRRLLANPDNFRTHPNKQRKAMSGSLDAIGWIQQVVVNIRTKHIIDGHLRVEQAITEGVSTIPVLWVDLNEQEEKEAILSMDPIAAMAHTNKESMTAMIAELIGTSGQIASHMEEIIRSSSLDIGAIMQNEGSCEDHGETDENPPPKWPVAPGEVWQMNQHRIVCGDCTQLATVDAVMGGEMADLVITDPPYGVDYASKNIMLNKLQKGNRIQRDIQNDNISPELRNRLWEEAFRTTALAMRKGAVIYCFMPQGGDQGMMMMMMMMRGAGIEPKHELIWVKNNHVLGRTDYTYKHEPILYAWKGTGHRFYGGFQTSVFEYDKPLKSKLHPTTKPLELIQQLMINSSQAGEIVYDPFLGSGTTIIASETLGRKGRGCEIDPDYCSVILERWHHMTGMEPMKTGKISENRNGADENHEIR